MKSISMKSKQWSAYDLHCVREHPYNTFKQRMHLMKQLTKKYDKVVNDNDKQTLYAYNKVYK